MEFPTASIQPTAPLPAHMSVEDDPHHYLAIQLAKGLPDDKLQALERGKQEVARALGADERPNLSSVAQGKVPNFEQAGHRAIPALLTEQYRQVQYKCFMGLFPEIQRAWYTFDHKLYLWKYEDDADFVMFDGLGEQVIVSVGLVRPKHNVFAYSVQWLLVVTTAVEVVVLAVSFDETTGELLLQPTSLSVPSDNVNMLQITGTWTGRIFMCGSDGHLYELDYQSPGSWFSRQCRKRNHSQSMLAGYLPSFLRFSSTDPIVMIKLDESRQLLYTLSRRSTLQVYWLGDDGSKMQHIARASQLHTQRLVSSRIYSRTAFDIVSISPVTRSESSAVHLVAVTSGGVRLYLSTNPHKGARPDVLEVIHVDFPIVELRQREPLIHTALYSYGALLMAATLQDGEDTIFSCNINAQLKQQGLNVEEVACSSTIPGKTWAIAERQLPSAIAMSESVKGLPRLNVANELITQHLIDPREFLCLSNQGLYTIRKTRPVDELSILLSESRGAETQAIADFFERYGDIEACAMCLMIAANLPAAGTSFDVSAPSHVSESLREWALTLYLSRGAGTTSQQRGWSTPLTVRYDAFANFLSRLLRPIWTLPIQRLTIYSKSEVENIRDGLASLQALLQQTHVHTVSGRPQVEVRVFDRLRGAGPSNQYEQEAFECLLTLLARAQEAVSLLLILNLNDTSIIERVSPDRLANTTFSAFVCTRSGIEITTNLLHLLMRTPETDYISHALARSCPQFFNETDLLHFQATKLIKDASRTNDVSSRRDLLRESLTILRKITMGLSYEDVASLVSDMKLLHFWRGVVEVTLLWAQSPANNQRGTDEDNRRRCFMEVFDVFEFLLQRTEEDADPSVNEKRVRQYHVLKDYCIKNGKKEFLEQLFRWYMEQGKLGEVYSITESPMLEEFLKTYDAPFLADYYMRTKRFTDAARTYVALADAPSKNTNLSARIAYLGHALANLKQAEGLEGQEVLNLQEKADVASLQRAVYNQLEAKQGQNEGEGRIAKALRALDERLFTISELYNDFAEPWGLHEVCLQLLHASNYDDVLLVKQLWGKVFASLRSQAQNQPNFQMRARVYVSKLDQLGRQCALSFKVFPLQELCQMLEQELADASDEASYDPAWVVKAMRGLGINFSELFDVYHNLFRTSERDRQFQLHLSAPLRHIVDSWMASMQAARDPALEIAQFERKRLPLNISEFVNCLTQIPGPKAKAEQQAWAEVSDAVGQVSFKRPY